MSIFTEQSLTLKLNTGADLSAATNPNIIYLSPGGPRGSWVATISGTQLVYNITSSDIITSGVWHFQTAVTIGGKPYFGDICDITFVDNL